MCDYKLIPEAANLSIAEIFPRLTSDGSNMVAYDLCLKLIAAEGIFPLRALYSLGITDCHLCDLYSKCCGSDLGVLRALIWEAFQSSMEIDALISMFQGFIEKGELIPRD